MSWIKDIPIKYFHTLFLLVLFLIPTLLDSYVNSNRSALWEPDDAEHYILKKTQLENCLLSQCEFNSNADNYIRNNFLDNDRIVKRALIDYHPAYSLVLLMIDKLFSNQYLAFQILNYLSSFFLIYFSLNFFKNFFVNDLNKSNILILYGIFFIFLSLTLVMWRDAFKLNFGIFIYLIDRLINFSEKKKITFYLINIFQIFIHPAGIICCLIVSFAHYLKLIRYDIKNIFIFPKKKISSLIYLFLTLIAVILYYFSGLKYVSADINIANVYSGTGIQNIIYLNLVNLKNYILSPNGVIFLGLLFLFIKKEENIEKILILALFLIIFFHIFNPSPNKNIIMMFDFFFKFTMIVVIFKIFLNNKKILNISFCIIVCIVQAYYLSKNLNNYLLVRPILDNLQYSKNTMDKNFFFKDNSKLIVINGDNDLLLYNQLNNGLINRKVYYTGFSSRDFAELLTKNESFYLIFDLFNNSFDLMKKKKSSGRSFSKNLNKGDIIKIDNREVKTFNFKLLAHAPGELLVDKKKVKYEKNEILDIEIKPKWSSVIKIVKEDKYLEILSLGNEENENLYLPWKKNISIEIYNHFLQDSLIIDFSEINLNQNCTIKKIYDDSYQNIYAEALCK